MGIDDLDDFTRHYLIAALWSTNDESTPEGGEPFDANYGLEDLHPSAIEQARNECAAFQHEAAGLLDFAYDRYTLSADAPTPQACAGHDFWLTRCHHGVGFWDRGFGDLGRHLTSLLGYGTNYPPRGLELGDDGKIYMTGG